MARKKRTQKEIDAHQDAVNHRQDQTDNKQDLVNFYQSVALIVYGVCLLSIFILAILGGYIK